MAIVVGARMKLALMRGAIPYPRKNWLGRRLFMYELLVLISDWSRCSFWGYSSPKICAAPILPVNCVAYSRTRDLKEGHV